MIVTKNKKFGLISILGMLVLAVIIILVLSYFNIRLQTVVESKASQDNIHYVGGATKTVWDKYFKDPAYYIWNDVWVNIFWKGFINNMERIRDGQPTDFDNATPKVNLQQ